MQPHGIAGVGRISAGNGEGGGAQGIAGRLHLHANGLGAAAGNREREAGGVDQGKIAGLGAAEAEAVDPQGAGSGIAQDKRAALRRHCGDRPKVGAITKLRGGVTVGNGLPVAQQTQLGRWGVGLPIAVRITGRSAVAAEGEGIVRHHRRVTGGILHSGTEEEGAAESLTGLIPRTTAGAIVDKGSIEEAEVAGAHEERTAQARTAAALAALFGHDHAVARPATKAGDAGALVTGASAGAEPAVSTGNIVVRWHMPKSAAATATAKATMVAIIILNSGATGIEIEGAATASAATHCPIPRDAPFAANRLVIAEGDMTDGDDAVVHIEPATSPQTATAAPPI